jgi:hypothetical protein
MERFGIFQKKTLTSAVLWLWIHCQQKYTDSMILDVYLIISLGPLMFLVNDNVLMMIMPDKGKVGCKRSWSIHQVCNCAQCAVQKKLVYCGALTCLAHVVSCGAETCPPPPRTLIPPSQATGDSIYLQLSRGMGLDSAHLVDLRAAQSRFCGYRTVYVHIVLYFSPSNTVSWNTPQMIIFVVMIVFIF